MTQEDLIQAVCDWLATVTTIPSDRIRIGGSGGPVDVKPRMTAHLIQPGVTVGRPERRTVADGDIQIVTHKRAVVQLDVETYGPEHGEFIAGDGLMPADHLDAVLVATADPMSKEAAKSFGFNAIMLSDPQDTTALVDTKHVARATSELTIGYRQDSTPSSAAGLIERVIGTIDVGPGVETDIDEQEPAP